MLSALLYLQYCSFKNRFLSRIKRLRQPKYLILAGVGAAYFYFYFFRYLFRRTGFSLSAAPPADLALYESVGALILFTLLLFAWILPHERAALVFTEAEVAFLFPAPIGRRGLIHFKLLRSQAAILLTTLFLTMFSNRFGGPSWIHAAGWWLVLSTLNLHMLGSSFARTMLLDHGITNWQRRAAILVLLVAIAVAVFVWMRNAFPRAQLSDLDSAEKVKEYATQVLESGPLPYLLYPFRLVVRPYLAPDVLGFLAALGPALLIVLLHYAWVVKSDVAFEEASVEASRKLAARITAIRSGNWRASGKQMRPRRAPFSLGPTGSPAIALFWKNLIATGQAVTTRTWIILAAVALGASIGLRRSSSDSGVLPAIGMFLGMLLIWSLLFGPQVLRQDFRQDLLFADVLKLFPMRGWQIALGELLAPAAVLTAIQWFLMILTIAFFSQPQSGIPRAILIASGASAALLLPLLDLILLLIPNVAVLLFPAWFQPGRSAAQGIEATGQRLIFLLAQLLVLAVALAPAGLLFSLVFFLVKMAIGTATAVFIASFAAAVILAIEGALGVMLLGRLFERLNLSTELTA